MTYSLLTCPVCTYNQNFLEAKNCELCGTPIAQTANLATVGSSKQLSRIQDLIADLAIVSTAQKAAVQMQDHLAKIKALKLRQKIAVRGNLLSKNNTKLFATNQPEGAITDSRTSLIHKDTATKNLYAADPWSSDSPESNLPTNERSPKNKIERTNKQYNRTPKADSGKKLKAFTLPVINRLTSYKSRANARVLLIAAAIFAIGSASTVFIYSRDNRQQQAVLPQQEPPSRYSDIKLYDKMRAVSNVPEGLFSYGGALCFAALQRDGMNAAISNAHPSFRLRYVEPEFSNPGCTTGIRMLLNGELSIAQNSRALTEAEVGVAASRGYKLDSVPVAIDGIVFYTDKSLGIKSLSLEQIRNIYRGKIRNWKQLGGKDLPITPIGLDPEIDSIMRLLMETENTPLIGKNMVIARDFTTAIRRTSSTPGAISYASSAILKGQQSIAPLALSANSESPPISALLADGTVNLQAFEKNVYPLTRRLFVVIRRDGTPEEKAGVAYTNLLLSKEGQAIFKQAGFVPLY